MNNIEFFLQCVGQEGCEVSMACSKASLFHVYGVSPVDGAVNIDRVREEVHHVVATYRLLMEELGLDATFDEEIILDKTKRTIESMKWARARGTLDLGG